MPTPKELVDLFINAKEVTNANEAGYSDQGKCIIVRTLGTRAKHFEDCWREMSEEYYRAHKKTLDINDAQLYYYPNDKIGKRLARKYEEFNHDDDPETRYKTDGVLHSKRQV